LDADDSAASGTGFVTTFTEGGSAVAVVDSDVTITDIDNTTVQSATVGVINELDVGFEALFLSSAGETLAESLTITVSGSNTSSLLLSGGASLVSYQLLLEEVRYANLSDAPTLTPRNIGVSVNDGVDDSNLAVAVVFINATNDVATILGANTGAVTEDAAVSVVSDAITVVDADSGESFFVPLVATGVYGSLQLTSAGGWTYTLDNADLDTDVLNSGVVVTDSFTVTSVDGSATEVIAVEVTGSNDVAIISGINTGAVVEDAFVNTVTGTLSVADVDSGEAFFTPQSTVGVYGSLQINSAGAWTYSLANADPDTNLLNSGGVVTDSFTVTSQDGSATDVITVTVTGSNDAAVIGGGAVGSVTEDAVTSTFSDVVTVLDVDSGEAVFVPQTTTGVYGRLEINSDGQWTYALDNADVDTDVLNAGDVVTDDFTVTSIDGSASQVISVLVTGSNDVATVSGVNFGSVDEDAVVNTVTDSLTVADVDDGEALFAPQTSVGVYGSLQINSAGQWTYTLDNADADTEVLNSGQVVSESFTVVSQDGSASDVITVTVTGANDTAIISGTRSGVVVEDAATNVISAVLNVSDVDSGEASFVPQTNVGEYGSLQFASDGNWTYTLNNLDGDTDALATAQSVVDSFVVTSFDGSASDVIAVTITGSNDGPSIDLDFSSAGLGFSAPFIEGASPVFIADIDVSITDVDDTTLESVTVTISNVQESGFERLSLGAATSLLPGFGVSASEVVSVTVTGANDTAIISGVNTGSLTEDALSNSVVGALTVVDVDSGW